MRKILIAAAAALTGLVVAAAAYGQAQDPAPAPTATTKVTPTAAGDRDRPKNSKIRLFIKNNVESKATASKLEITAPSTIKISGRGLTACDPDELAAEGPSACPRASRAGTGIANALVGPRNPAPVPLKLDITAFVGGTNVILFYVDGRELDVVGVLPGRLSGRKLTIEIPQNLREPAPGLFSALVDIDTTLSLKKGRNFLVSSTGCKSRKHSFSTKVSFVPNPTPPVRSTATAKSDARCS